MKQTARRIGRFGARIAAVVIARDEAATLPATLASIDGLIDSAVFIVDRRSSDATFDLCQAFARKTGNGSSAHLADFLDPSEMTEEEILRRWGEKSIWDVADGGFSGARNLGLSLLSDTEWVLSIDAHEVLVTRREFAALKIALAQDAALANVAAVGVTLRLEGESETDGTTHQLRLFRPDKARWAGLIHNRLVAVANGESLAEEARVIVPEIVLAHRPVRENRVARFEQREDMITRLCRRQLDNDPMDKRALWFLANQRMVAEDWHEAISLYEFYLAATGDQAVGKDAFRDERDLAFRQLAIAYQRSAPADDDSGERTAWEGIAENPDNAPLWMFLADLEASRGNHAASVVCARHARSCTARPTTISLPEADFTWKPISRMIAELEALGRIEEAFTAAIEGVNLLVSRRATRQLSPLAAEQLESMTAWLKTTACTLFMRRHGPIGECPEAPRLLIVEGELTGELGKRASERFNVSSTDRFDLIDCLAANAIIFTRAHDLLQQALACPALRLARIPMIVCIGQSDLQHFRERDVVLEIPWAAVHTVVMDAPETREEFERRWGKPPVEIIVMANGLDPKEHPPVARHGKPARDFVWIGSGAIEDHQAIIRQIAHKLYQISPTAMLHLPGSVRATETAFAGLHNVVLAGYQPELGEFLRDKDAVITTQPLERLGQRILIPALMGLSLHLFGEHWQSLSALGGAIVRDCESMQATVGEVARAWAAERLHESVDVSAAWIDLIERATATPVNPYPSSVVIVESAEEVVSV